MRITENYILKIEVSLQEDSKMINAAQILKAKGQKLNSR